MVTKSNNPLTEDEIAKYNAAIADFVKKNSNYVNYSELDDGNTYITLQYGMVRNSALREIANRCRASLTDEVFKIGTLNCTIQFATSGILRFVGKTAEIHAELPNLDKETYGELIKKTSSEINLPASLTADVGSLASTIATFASLSDSKLAEMGITTSTIGNKKHISFDVSKIEKYATKNPSNEQAVALNGAISSVIGAYKEFPKATLTKITESLSSAGLELERLNGSVIMLSLGVAKPSENEDDPSGTDQEFEYEKVPGKITKIILHYGAMTHRNIQKEDLVIERANVNMSLAGQDGGYEYGFYDAVLLADKDGTIYGRSAFLIAPGSAAEDQDYIDSNGQVDEKYTTVVPYETAAIDAANVLINDGDIRKVKTAKKVLITLPVAIDSNINYVNNTYDGKDALNAMGTPSLRRILALGIFENEQLVNELRSIYGTEHFPEGQNISDTMDGICNDGLIRLGSSDGIVDFSDYRDGANAVNWLKYSGDTSGSIVTDWIGSYGANRTRTEVLASITSASGIQDIADDGWCEYGSSTISVQRNIIVSALESGRALDLYIGNITD